MLNRDTNKQGNENKVKLAINTINTVELVGTRLTLCEVEIAAKTDSTLIIRCLIRTVKYNRRSSDWHLFDTHNRVQKSASFFGGLIRKKLPQI